MITYETYKILHIFTLMMTISAMGGIISNGMWINSKIFKVITGFLSFLIFVAGMGLIARLGFKYGEPFPTWIIVKIVMWILFNISLVSLFKVEQKKFKILFAVIAFASIFLAIYTAITKLA